MMILVRGPNRRSNCRHRRFRHGDAACGWTKIVAGQVQEHRAAAAGDTWPRVVVDLDDEIIEMVGALEPVAALLASAPDPLVVVAIAGVLAPGVRAGDDPGRQRGMFAAGCGGRPPPQLPWPVAAPGGAAIALALVGQNAAAPQRHRNRQRSGGQPAPAWITGRRLNADRGELSGSSILGVTG